MAAPSVSYTSFVLVGEDLENNTSAVSGSNSFVVATAGGNRGLFGIIDTVTSGDTLWLEIAFDSVADLSSAMVAFNFQSRAFGSNAQIGFFTTSDTDYALWNCSYTAQASIGGDILQCVLDANATPDTEVGTFNPVSVAGLRFQWTTNVTGTSSSNNAGFRIETDVTSYSALQLNDGEPGDLASIANYISDIQTNILPISGVVYSNFSAFDKFLESLFDLTLAPADYGPNISAIVFPDNRTDSSNGIYISGGRSIVVDTAATETISGLNIINNHASSVVDFSENSAQGNTLNINFSGLNLIGFGDATVTSSVLNPTDTVSNGATIADLTIDGSTATNAAYSIGASTTITALAIENCTSGFAIDLSAYSGTLDLTGLTLSGNTFGTNIVRFNSASNLTVTVSASSGITTGSGSGDFGDATVSGGGTLTIINPQPTVSVIGFPNGSTVSISQSGIQLDLVNDQNPPYTYQTLSTEQDNYTFKVVTPGFKDFITTIDRTQATVAIWTGTPTVTQDQISYSYLSFYELMAADTAFQRIIDGDLTLSKQLWSIQSWQTEWNTAVVADEPTLGEIAAWIGYLTTAGYPQISFNALTGEVG